MSAPAGQPQVWQPTPTGANNNQFQSLFQAQPAMGGKGGSNMNTQFRPTQMVTTQMQKEADAFKAAEAPLSVNNAYGIMGGDASGGA